MKSFALALLLAAPMLATPMLGGNVAFAGSDDAKWVAQCVYDNRDEKAAVEVVTKYCVCMNNKMDDNETKSITQWEKSHPAEMKACDKVAGWR